MYFSSCCSPLHSPTIDHSWVSGSPSPKHSPGDPPATSQTRYPANLLNWVKLYNTNICQLEETGNLCPVFLLVLQPATFYHSWVAQLAPTPAPTAPLLATQVGLPRPAIRQITRHSSHPITLTWINLQTHRPLFLSGWWLISALISDLDFHSSFTRS